VPLPWVLSGVLLRLEFAKKGPEMDKEMKKKVREEVRQILAEEGLF
jgi:hypothetical protein